jgi:hypothetical protein
MPHAPQDRPPEAHEAAHQVVWLIKRPAYRCTLAVPAGRPLWESADGAVVQLCFTRSWAPQSVLLTVREVEELGDGLRQLVDYLRRERARRPQPPAPGRAADVS